jgi:hypothetical protein
MILSRVPKITIAVILFLSLQSAFGQDSTKKWQPLVGLTFTTLPAATVSGHDTIYKSSLSVSPFIELRNKKSGFGFSYSPSFVLGGIDPGIYVHTVTIGIEQYEKPKFDLVADYMHYFFTNNQSSPVSILNNEVYTYLCYKKGLLQPSFSADLGFAISSGKKSSSFLYDAAFSAGVGHAFEWELSNFTIDAKPSLLLNAGTDNYFSFMKGSHYISRQKNFKKYLKNSSGFNLTVNNIELNLESSLEKGPWSIRPSFSIFIPVSGVTGIDGYGQLSISYKF